MSLNEESVVKLNKPNFVALALSLKSEIDSVSYDLADELHKMR